MKQNTQKQTLDALHMGIELQSPGWKSSLGETRPPPQPAANSGFVAC